MPYGETDKHAGKDTECDALGVQIKLHIHANQARVLLLKLLIIVDSHAMESLTFPRMLLTRLLISTLAKL